MPQVVHELEFKDRLNDLPGQGQHGEARDQIEPGPPQVQEAAAYNRSLRALERDSYASTALADVIDRSLHAAAARFTAGISPAATAEAYFDWMTHLAASPGKRLQLMEKAFRKSIRLNHYLAECMMRQGIAEPCILPLPQDRRFLAAAWQSWPFNVIQQSFLLQQQWWHNATTGVRGVTLQHEQMVAFAARQWLDMTSPSNLVLTNPVVLDRTVRECGMNLVRGFGYMLEDWERKVAGRMPVGAETFIPGKKVATAPGKVVFRNRLIELIQYQPTTQETRPEPIMIVPAWIMKYYILDLSPENSLVRYLTDNGFTVFMISWKNPDPEDRDLGMEDYLQLGPMAAMDAISTIVPGARPHAVGYCLGGTLLSIASAAMARDSDSRLASVTLLAAQTDFHEAGELMLFINDSQLSFLEDMMWEQGFLDTSQMAGAFQILRSNDLVWSRMVHEYLMGDREPMIDLTAWNADATRMPYRMHSEYLRRLFLENELAEGRFPVANRPIALNDVHVPMFCVSTQQDHVAPWRSVHKIHILTDTDLTFLLTTGGHNAGIVSQPGRLHRSFQCLTRVRGERYLDPDQWLSTALQQDGSWWPEWLRWLIGHSGSLGPNPEMGAADRGYPPLADAPGSYVLQH